MMLVVLVTLALATVMTMVVTLVLMMVLVVMLMVLVAGMVVLVVMLMFSAAMTLVMMVVVIMPLVMMVAQGHAKDMAKRGYAADATPEGLSLLDTVRREDRQTLYSSFGTAIAIAEAGADARSVLAALMSEPSNSENLLRGGFDHVGIGSFEQDGRLYVVQLLARVEGRLEEPLPMYAGDVESLRAELSARGMTPVSWSVNDQSGQTLLRGTGERIRDSQGSRVEGYLNLDVVMGPDVYTFRGPYVRVK